MKLFLALSVFLFVHCTAFAQPHAEFLLIAPDGCINDNISPINLSFGGVTEYFWEFGDGNTSAVVSPTHTYLDTGTYTITLTVTDGDGLTDSWTESYKVNPPIADFVLVPEIGCAIPHTVFFTDQSTLPDTWLWDFGDGSTSTLQNPIHNYTIEGEFIVTLTVTDTVFGCSDTYEDIVFVSIPTATVDGEFGHFGCAPLTVDFEESSSPGALGELVSWEWDFGDGNTSDEMEPTHVYDSPGIYNVALTVTNSLGCSTTELKPAFVQAIGPDVNFGADTLFAPCPDFTVNFTDSTIFGAPIISWDWDFGDGGTSALINPTYVYTDFGIYDVSLTVTDIDGCSRTLTFAEYISVQDTVPPSFDTCPGDQTESLSADCDFELPDYTALALASDNCTALLTITQSPAPGTIITANQVITLETSDEQDSTALCTFTVYLVDEIDPTITCPPDQNVSFDADCAFILPDYTSMATAEDNCLTPTLSQLPAPGTAIFATSTITLIATDTAANTASCSFDVIPVDDISPEITCPDDLTLDSDDGLCGSFVSYDTPVGTDNCVATTTLTAGLASGAFFPVGTTTVTYQVSDDVGLSASCSFEITIIDNELPTLACPDDIVQVNDLGECTAVVIFDEPLAADNCGIASLTQTAGLASGTEFPIGITTNVFETMDLNGNTASCTFDVEVIDNEVPEITCPADLSVCTDIVEFSDPTVIDNCDGFTVTLLSGLPSGSEFPLGTTTNSYEVEDASGNSATCTFDITRNPIPALDPGENLQINAGDSVQLNANSPSADLFNWSPSDGLNDPNSSDPKASPLETTTYLITVTTVAGCENSAEITVAVNQEILINNYMSPNGDGKNDTWIIKGAYILIDCQVAIHDSWGNRVYESTGYDNSWDGTNAGNPLPEGIYYYIISCGTSQPQTGSITLIR